MKEADVILHVRDIASDETDAQAADVRAVLARLGVDLEQRRVVEVWNKSDLVDDETHARLTGDARRANPPALLLSAASGEGCETLLAALCDLVDEAPPVAVHAPAGDGAAIAWLYRHGRVMDRDAQPDGGTTLSVRLSPKALGQFEAMFPEAEVRA